MPVTDPQPAPAKQVPVSPTGLQGDDSPAQTPGSLPPVRRPSPGTETPSAAETPPAECPGRRNGGAAEPSQADEQVETAQQANAHQMGSNVTQLAMGLAAASAPTAMTASDRPASAPVRRESAEQAADHLQDDVPDAGSLALSVQALPTVAAGRRESTEAAEEHAGAAPVEVERRASVIMMDAEHTPEVSSGDMHLH